MNSADEKYVKRAYRIIPMLFFAGSALRGGVVIKPGTPITVPVGTSLKFSANVPVRWSLEPGSAGSVDSDGTYHAPQSIPVKVVVGGCQLLPSDHVFNTRVDALPLDPKSDYYMRLFPPARVGYFTGWGTNIADHSAQKKPMHFFYTPHHDGLYEFVPWPELKRQSGVFTDPLSGEDRHELTVDRDSCRFYEVYNRYDPGVNKSCPGCTAQSGVQYGPADAALPQGSVDAAGLLLLPLTLHLNDIRSGEIQHALRVTLRNSIIGPYIVWPATARANAWGHIPYGSRFRLKSSYDISKFSPIAQVLLRQLQRYGLIVADGGADWAVSASTDLSEDATVIAALDEVWHKGPTSRDFEVADESSLMISPGIGLVNTENGHVKPDSFATVIATDARDSKKAARVRVLLQGVTVGVPDPTVWIQSGVTQQLVAWVNSTEIKSLKWSMEPVLGELTSGGRYTAPEVSRPTHTNLTVSSVVDPNAKATVELVVLPPGPIRVKIGNASTARNVPNHFAPDYGPDSEGHMWWRDQAGEVTWGVVWDDGDGDIWPNQKDIQLYYTSRYSWGDMVYKFFVPNGKYKITLLFAQPGDHGQHATYPKEWRTPIHLEAQSRLLIRDFDMGAGIGYMRKQPIIVPLPAEVTNHSLYFALRRVTSFHSATVTPLFNGYVIERDESPAHVSIVPEKVTSLVIRQTISFTAVGWSIPDGVKWSVVKGGGTISPTGVYTAPAEPPPSDEQIVVEARSASDSSKVAKVEMVFQPGKMAVSPDSASIARSLTHGFKATVSGAPYDNVAWSISPEVGTISAEGLYTAPEKLAADTAITIKAQSKSQISRSATATLILKAVPDPIRVNCGGSEFKDAHGNIWSADKGFSAGIPFSMNVAIPNAPIDMLPLYQSSRYVYANDRFNYHFSVPNGRYRVTLKFSDYVFTDPGHHVFDVKINNATVLTNFDANAISVSRVAVDKTFETIVKDKSITIEFLAHAGGAIINGIEIQYVSAE